MKKTLLLIYTIIYFAMPLPHVFAQITRSAPTPAPSVLTYEELKQKTDEFKILVERYRTGGLTVGQKQSLLGELGTLKIKIYMLLAEIRKMESAAQAQTNTSAYCHDFYLNLSVGSQNNDVVALNALLDKAGYGGEVTASGVYSNVYTSALAAKIRSYQSRNAIQNTGTVGPLTRKSLNSIFGCREKVQRVTVVHPQDRTFTRGEQINFQWFSHGTFGVSKIVLLPERSSQREIVVYELGFAELPIVSNNRLWTIPSDVPAGQYKVAVSIGRGDLLRDVSETAITIQAKNTVELPPALRLNSLQGGSKYTKGKNYPLSWTAASSGTVAVDIINATTGAVTRLTSFVGKAGNNNYSITIPEALSDGSYKIRLTSNNEIVESERVFTVQSPTPTSTVTPSPTNTPVYSPSPSPTSTATPNPYF